MVLTAYVSCVTCAPFRLCGDGRQNPLPGPDRRASGRRSLAQARRPPAQRRRCAPAACRPDAGIGTAGVTHPVKASAAALAPCTCMQIAFAMAAGGLVCAHTLMPGPWPACWSSV